MFTNGSLEVGRPFRLNGRDFLIAVNAMNQAYLDRRQREVAEYHRQLEARASRRKKKEARLKRK